MSAEQKTFDFEPQDTTSSLVLPEYWRQDIPGEKYDGISPREGFLRLNDLLIAGHTTEEVYPHIQQWGTRKELTFGNRVLAKIGTGVAAIDYEQQENANKFRTALRASHEGRKGLSEEEYLWWWYELHVSRNVKKNTIFNKLSKGDKIFIDKARSELGRFRDEIRSKYEELMVVEQK